MAVIEIEALGNEHFEVTIDEGGSTSTHIVTATGKQLDLLCDDCSPEQLIEGSMRFLLDRESKESIMSQFDLDVITRFFPEYPATIGDYL